MARIVEEIDIAPTLFELIGLPPPPEWSGRSFASLLREGGSRDAAQIGGRAFAEVGPGIRSIRTPRWRYVENSGGAPPDCRPYRDAWARGDEDVGYEIAERELFDLASPEGEGVNAIDRYPSVAAELRQRLRAKFAGQSAAPRSRGELDPDVVEELREMGYIE